MKSKGCDGSSYILPGCPSKGGALQMHRRAQQLVACVSCALDGGRLWAQTGAQPQLPNTVRVPVADAGPPFPEFHGSVLARIPRGVERRW